MEAVRLTQDMRRTIVRTVQDKVMTPKDAEFSKYKSEALEMYLNFIIPPEDRELLKKLDDAYINRPESFCITTLTKDGRVQGKMWIDNSHKVPFKDTSDSHGSDGSLVLAYSDEGWSKTFRDIVDKSEELDNQRRELRNELQVLVNACKTTKELVERFPDIENYIVLDVAKSLPLVVDFTKLNSLLR